MENSTQIAWEKFMQSGKINDYVAYIKTQGTAMTNGGTAVSQGEITSNANNNTGLNTERNEYR